MATAIIGVGNIGIAVAHRSSVEVTRLSLAAAIRSAPRSGGVDRSVFASHAEHGHP